MVYLSKFLVILVALEHFYIMALEMFFWTSPKALKMFGFTQELAEQTTSMAANQGLYNGFLAAGLLWGLLHKNKHFSFQIQAFFLTCVVVAAVYGSVTVKTSIIFMQGLPAILALIALVFTNKGREQQIAV